MRNRTCGLNISSQDLTVKHLIIFEKNHRNFNINKVIMNH